MSSIVIPPLEARPLDGFEQAERSRLESQVKNSLAIAHRHSAEYYKAKQQARIALKELKKSNLWKDNPDDEHDRPILWDEYCQATFGLSRRHVLDLIGNAEVVKDLEEASSSGTIVPLKDGALRELIHEPTDIRVKVYQEVVDGGFRPTAKKIREVKQKLKEQKKIDESDRLVINFVDQWHQKSNDRQAKLANRTRCERHHDQVRHVLRDLERLGASLNEVQDRELRTRLDVVLSGPIAEAQRILDVAKEAIEQERDAREARQRRKQA